MPLNPTLTERQLANVSGLLALLLLVAAGAMMTFRRSLLARTRYADGLRTVHVVVSALAGLFLIIHVAALISFPLTFDALLGYVASGAALLIWITGETYLKGVRRSLPPHAAFLGSRLAHTVPCVRWTDWDSYGRRGPHSHPYSVRSSIFDSLNPNLLACGPRHQHSKPVSREVQTRFNSRRQLLLLCVGP